MKRIHGLKLVLTVLFLLLSGDFVHAKDPVRIDASTDASAQASWDQLIAKAPRDKKQKLQIALVQLNLVGVNSAYEVVSNPALQSPSVSRIKDKIAGLTADEIIELANRTSTVKVQQSGQ